MYGKKTKQNYCAVLTLVISKNKITIATNSIDECIDRALQEFTGSMFEVSRCMRKKCELGKSHKGGSAWFDAECYQKNKLVRRMLSCFKTSGLDEDKILYSAQRKE